MRLRWQDGYACLKFDLRTAFVGVHYQRLGHSVDLWICPIPCCLIYVTWWWSREPKNPYWREPDERGNHVD